MTYRYQLEIDSFAVVLSFVFAPRLRFPSNRGQNSPADALQLCPINLSSDAKDQSLAIKLTGLAPSGNHGALEGRTEFGSRSLVDRLQCICTERSAQHPCLNWEGQSHRRSYRPARNGVRGNSIRNSGPSGVTWIWSPIGTQTVVSAPGG